MQYQTAMDFGNALEESLEASEIAICVKDANKKVLEQNDLCRRICGDRLGELCNVGCMELHSRDESRQWKDWGSRLYANSFIHGGFYDVTLMSSAHNIISFLQPLKAKHEIALAYYRDKGLTRRESEVVALTVRGVSNVEICDRLSISKATLRTHLNNIYRKLRDLGEVPEFMPAHRLGD